MENVFCSFEEYVGLERRVKKGVRGGICPGLIPTSLPTGPGLKIAGNAKNVKSSVWTEIQHCATPVSGLLSQDA